ncbi:MAG: EAL domain-containing protein [Aquabacterium sp.]|uniref:bifunctional diguanylate cyclase/phosphodiesterase n=1 Tax=Aquabacterium sp. TaxID=1872578 RepID=UPI00271AF019|nr:EAL domain-containing protein [Aquabacterium sp.]MDO9002294.1 EAL domain-containing protein [Aquabacterium sp.]
MSVADAFLRGAAMTVETTLARTLSEHQALFKQLVDSSPDAIMRHDATLRCIYANATLVFVSGQPMDTIVGALPQELPFVFDAKAYAERLHNVLRLGTASGFEMEWGLPDGTVRWCQVRLVPERDAVGRVVGVMSVCHDITAHKELQAKLEKAEGLAKIGFWELDLASNKARMSDHACRLMGRLPGWSPTTEELLAIHSEEEGKRIRHLYETAIQRRDSTVQYDYTVVVDGEVRHLHLDAEIAYTVKGKPKTFFAVSQDFTERALADERLRAREQEYRVLVENTPDNIARYDRDCRRVYVNEALVKWLGQPREALIGVRPGDHIDAPQAREYERTLALALSTGELQEFTYRLKDKDRRDRTVHLRIVPERDKSGEVISVLSIGRDISALEATERRLEDAQRIARICHWEWDYVTRRSSISRVGLDVLGLSSNGDLTMEDFQAIMLPDERASTFLLYQDAFAKRQSELSYEHSLILPDGSQRETHSWVRLEYGQDGRAVRALGVTQDVTDLKALQRQTHQLEFYDPLTSLPNRALLHDRLKLAMADANRQGGSVGVVLLDIDHFQKINDSLGTGAGDVLLKSVASRLSQALREYDTVARLGGDEFAIIVPQIRQPSDLDVVASRIKHVFEASVALNDTEIFVTASAGIAMFPADGTEVNELMAHADAAMYHAKNCGRDNFQFYARELTATALERLKIEGDLRKAIERNELELFYQPKVELSSGRVVGAEALMRWRHPERGLVPPDRFIGIAEDTGLIIDMGEWALRTACTVARQWHDQHGKPLKIAVNLSPRQFYSGDLVATVSRALEDTGCLAEWIELEITESLLLNDRVDIRSMLEALHGMGFTIAIDDFGTGYSALSYLTRFPVDTLKIDRSFIRELTTDRDSAVLAKAIVTLARSLRMEVVAEGVETALQRDHLGAWGCHLAQGFHYSKPVPLADFVALLAQWTHNGSGG